MKSIFKDNKGAAAVEFAILVPVFFVLIFGMLEFGLFQFHKIMIENIATDIGRISSLGKISDVSCPNTTSRIEYISCVVKIKSKNLINGNQVSVTYTKVATGNFQTPDICLDLPEPSSQPITCKLYQEQNDIPGYQGLNSNNYLGVAGDIIQVTVTYPWQVSVPFVSDYVGKLDPKTGKKSGITLIQASTVIKNEDF